MAINVTTPDNLLLHEAKAGEIPKETGELVIKEVMENSVIMRLGKLEPMTKQEKEFEYFAEGPGAYWVSEAEKIQTSKPKWLKVKMVAKKLGVILPVSREYLQYRRSDFFALMRPRIAEAFYQKFDEAAILNVSNPYTQSIEQSTATRTVSGDINYNNILALEDKLLEEDFEANAFISKSQNVTLLRGAYKAENGVGQYLYDGKAKTLDGLPIVNLKSKVMPKGRLYAGDFDYIRYGIPFNINYLISQDAQLSTLTNADGTPVNLYEQELIALRATMDIAFMVIKDEAFAKLTPVTV